MARAALLFAFVFFFKSLKSVAKFLMWCFKIKTVGTIIGLKDKKVNFENEKKGKVSSTEYVYDMQVLHEGEEKIVEFIEVTSKEKPSGYQIGMSIPIYFNVTENKVINSYELKRELWQNPLWMLICLVICVVCLGLAFLIQYN